MGNGTEKCLIVQPFSVPLIFPLWGWDGLKRPKGEIRAEQEQEERTVCLCEGIAPYSWAVLGPHSLHFKYMGTGGNDV